MDQANLKHHLDLPSPTLSISIQTMPGTPCGAVDCAYVTQEGTLDQQIQLLSLHVATAHPPPKNAQTVF